VSIYNGSAWSVREVVYHIKSVFPAAGPPTNPFDDIPEWERDFKSSVFIEPLTRSKDFVTVGQVRGDNKPEWTITHARGIPPKPK